MGKKLCGVLLALVMALSLLPTLASATTNFDDGTWTVLTKDCLEGGSVNYTLSGGNYYLTGDVTLDKPLVVTGASANSSITLDLNGHVLQMTGSGSVIEVQPFKDYGSSGGNTFTGKPTSFTLQDSDPTAEHKFNKTNDLWVLAEDSATGDNIVTVYGGVITGGTGTSYNGVDRGGGIYITGTNEKNSVTMTGGSIVGCTADHGGGVYVDMSTSFAMSGSAQICGCTATIYGESYAGTGGGIHNLGKLTLQDSVMIADCAATDQDSTAIYNSGSGGENGTICANGGEVHGTVYSTGSSGGSGKITSSSGGTVTRFYGDVTNAASVIENGEFYGTVTNKAYTFLKPGTDDDWETGCGKITGGTFYGSITSEDSSFKCYTVTLDPNGGTIKHTALYVVSGNKLTPPAAPTRDGYTFVGWFTEKTGGTEVTANTVFEENTTLYARWSSGTTYYYYNTTTADKIEAPKTFDAGIAMYGVMAVISVTGMAYVGKKRF